MKLLLIYPEIESSNTNTSTYSLSLGLGSIATYCKQRISGLEVKILDGSILTHEQQLDEIGKFKPDVTGIGPTIASQGNGLELGKKVKSLGSLVIYGGVNSTNLWRNMLTNRKFIDGIVLYDGEVPMYQILIEKSPEETFNLAYRDSQGTIHEPKKILIPQLHDLPDIDYSLFDMGLFLEQTQKKGFGKASTYYAGKGCSKRGGIKTKDVYSYHEYLDLVNSMNACSFCGRNELGFRTILEEREERIIKYLNKDFGITGFFNIQDTVNLTYTSPIGLKNAWFRLFISPENITKRNIKILKQRYGDNLIFQAGIESAAPHMRKTYGKPVIDIKSMFEKVELMMYEGVKLHASFILGGRGETLESMRKTTKTIKKLAKYSNIDWLLVSQEIVLPGSRDFRKLLNQHGVAGKYAHLDLIDIVEISNDFLSEFSPELTREIINKEIKLISDGIHKEGRTDLVLDVKGVVKSEEAYINPQRPYTCS